MALALASFSSNLTSPDELVRDLGHFPSSPVVLPALMAQLSDDTVELSEVVDLIKLDAGIAARILQVANSAYYVRSGRCDFIAEAVHRIGFLRTYQLVSFASASRLLMEPLTTYGLSARELWRRSVSAAIAAEILAETCGLNPQLAYTAGLFHGIGLLAIDTWARHREPAPRVRSSGYPMEMTGPEAVAFGFDNAAVAASLLRSWRFPEEIVEAVRWQFRPDAADAPNQRLACVLSVSRWLRDAVAAAPGAQSLLFPSGWELEAVGQTADGIVGLIEEIREAFADATYRLGDLGLGETALLRGSSAA